MAAAERGGEPLDRDLLDGLDVALNEAELCDLRINERTGEVRLLLLLLSLPEQGPEPSDRRTVVSLTGVSRIVASLRKGPGNDQSVEAEPLALEDLPSAVRSFGCQPIHGWDFFDVPERPGAGRAGQRGDPQRTIWRDRASIDFSVGQGRGEHSIDLFQESAAGEPRRLDLRIEFDEMSVKNAKGRLVPLDEVVAGARRWWAALRAGDPRVAGHRIRLAGPAEEGD